MGIKVKVERDKQQGPLPPDIGDRVWGAAAKHEGAAHENTPNALGYHIEYAPLCLTCKACKVEIPVDLT